MAFRPHIFVRMLAVASLIAGATVAAPVRAQTSSSELSCADPNVAAHIVVAATPVTPPEARTLGLSGDVVVQVSLNEQSQITEARVIRSASGYFNNPALAATRSSKFAAEIKNCVPVAGTYAFIVRFVVRPLSPPEISAYFIGTWHCMFAGGGQSVIAIGLNAGGAMAFDQGEVATDRRIGNASGLYTETDGVTSATDTSKNDSFSGTSPGWQGQTLTFTGSRRAPTGTLQSGAPAFRETPETLTYVRTDDAHFTRTIVVNGQIESSESCSRL